MDGGGEEGGGARNRSCILLGSLRLLGRRGLERIAGERTMEGLEGGIGGKGIARGIEIVKIGERGLVARAGIKEAMYSKDTIREESIRDEKDVTMGKERIDIEGKEADT